MNKKNKQKQSNVIPFPRLEERLLHKGMEALKARSFKDALHIFNQLSEYNDDYPEVEVGIVVCLLELGLYEDAKEKCESLLQQDVGDYFNVLQIYITILIQLSEYDEVVSILEALFEEEKIPFEYAEELFHLLEFSRKRVDQPIEQGTLSVTLHDLEQQLLNGDVDKQLQAIHKLNAEKNILGVVQTIKDVLMDKNAHPIVQSMLLQLIIDQQVNEIITVNKFNQSLKLNPSEMNTIFDQPFSMEVINKLDDVLGQENPTLFENVKQLWERFLFIIFPINPEPQVAALWAAALHKLGYKLFGIDISDDELTEIYHIKQEGVAHVFNQIVEVEKLSIFGIEH